MGWSLRRLTFLPSLDDFTPNSLPPHISIYTWPSCTLSELATEIAASKPSALPYPAVGTRLAFQLVHPDLRGATAIDDTLPRYAAKDLGSIVIGQGGPGAETSASGDSSSASRRDTEVERTLEEARFVVGDYVSCAILPPLSDGSVAPAHNARRDASFGTHDTRGQRGGYGVRENGFARGGGRGGGRRDWGGAGVGFPIGDWRRGETLPEASPARPRRGGGRW